MLLFTSHLTMTSSRLAAVVSERFPSAGKHTWIRARSFSERQLNNGRCPQTRPEQTKQDQHRHQGLRNEAGTPSFSTRWFPPPGHSLLIRVGSRCIASSTRNRLSAPGSPSPRGAHSHLPIESWMPPSANAGTAPKCDHAFASHHLTSGQGVPRRHPGA